MVLSSIQKAMRISILRLLHPWGPIPDIESGVEKGWSKIKAGGVKLP